MRDIAYYAQKKNELMRSANQTNNPEYKRELLKAFCKCDEYILRLTAFYKAIKVWVIVVNVAVLLSIFCHGCQTLKGGLGDSAWIVQKLADNIQVQEK